MKIFNIPSILLMLFISNNTFGLTSECSHGGGFFPWIKHFATYNPEDYFFGGSHAILTEVFSPLPDYALQPEPMTTGGGFKQHFLSVTGNYGYYDFSGASMVGIHEDPNFFPFAPWYTCDDILDYKEVTTSFSVQPSEVNAGEIITATWNGINATICENEFGTFSTSGQLPVVATEDLNGTTSLTCYYEHDTDTSDPVTITVNPSCFVSSQDNFAVSTLSSWPVNVPYEQAVTFNCANDSLEAKHNSTSFSACTDHPQCGSPPQDPCKSKILWASGGVSVSAAHRHPFFTSSSQFTAGVGCHGDTTPKTLSFLNNLNNINNNFGEGGDPDDFDFSVNNGPLFLLTPTGSNIKVLENQIPRTVQ